MGILTAKDGQFWMDGKPFRILSGAIHYFRVVPEYWKDRLTKLKACGFNTVETYIAWNMQEPEEGEFCFTGMCDLEKFIRTAAEVGLYVILRPGPYICAEWDLGGFPGWLIRDRSMRLRCNYPPYLEKISRYFDELIPRLTPFLSTMGGPVIAVQVENEYGSYGNDKEYLRWIEEALRSRGVDCMLFTSDGDDTAMLNGGTLPHILKMVNFGSRAERNFTSLGKVQPDLPKMCCEFWDGWFDHWGNEHHLQDPKTASGVLDDILNMGGSVNMYMFHGGTNFGFYNGANFNDTYCPTVTSYDYDALLSEAGDITPKYELCKAVLEKHFGKAEEIPVENSRKCAYGAVNMEKIAGLFDMMDMVSSPVHSACTLSMEELGQDYGFVLYRSQVKGPVEHLPIKLRGMLHRALIFVDGKYQGTVYCAEEEPEIFLDVENGKTACLEILVENMGRVNYGEHLGEQTGITKGVKLAYQFQFGWDMYPLPMKDLSKVEWRDLRKEDGPAFYQGNLIINGDPCDTYLKLDGFHKGVVYINGFNLGRYWEKGPQKTLYVPAPVLKEGTNTVEVFEQYALDMDIPTVEFVDQMQLG